MFALDTDWSDTVWTDTDWLDTDSDECMESMAYMEAVNAYS